MDLSTVYFLLKPVFRLDQWPYFTIWEKYSIPGPIQWDVVISITYFVFLTRKMNRVEKPPVIANPATCWLDLAEQSKHRRGKIGACRIEFIGLRQDALSSARWRSYANAVKVVLSSVVCRCAGQAANPPSNSSNRDQMLQIDPIRCKQLHLNPF